MRGRPSPTWDSRRRALAGGFQYAPGGVAWVFSGNTGITGNGNAFTSGNPVAPEGVQVAFVQQGGSIAQTANLSAGQYTVSFKAAQRGNYQFGAQVIEVRMDGVTVGQYQPPATTYGFYQTAPFNIASTGAHTLTLVGTGGGGTDFTGFIDDVRIDTVAKDASGSGMTSVRSKAATPARVGRRGVPATDFGGLGRSDVVWQQSGTGSVELWFMQGSTISSKAYFNVPSNWQLVGTGDFDGDGKADLLWRDPLTGDTTIWFMNGGVVAGTGSVTLSTDWPVVALADVNGDGNVDILYRHPTTGELAISFMDQSTTMRTDFYAMPANWSLETAADLDGDGNADLTWRETLTGAAAIWFMRGGTRSSSASYSVPLDWEIAGAGNLNGDGSTDLLWRNSSTGDLVVWYMNDQTIGSIAAFNMPTDWLLVSSGDFDGDGKDDMLWRNVDGSVAIWFMDGSRIADTANFRGAVVMDDRRTVKSLL